MNVYSPFVCSRKTNMRSRHITDRRKIDDIMIKKCSKMSNINYDTSLKTD